MCLPTERSTLDALATSESTRADCHTINEMTDTGYTSWTTDRGIAEELAQYASREVGLSGRVVIFMVRIITIDEARIWEGESREDEYLIEGTVENVQFSEDADGEVDD